MVIVKMKKGNRITTPVGFVKEINKLAPRNNRQSLFSAYDDSDTSLEPEASEMETMSFCEDKIRSPIPPKFRERARKAEKSQSREINKMKQTSHVLRSQIMKKLKNFRTSSKTIIRHNKRQAKALGTVNSEILQMKQSIYELLKETSQTARQMKEATNSLEKANENARSSFNTSPAQSPAFSEPIDIELTKSRAVIFDKIKELRGEISDLQVHLSSTKETRNTVSTENSQLVSRVQELESGICNIETTKAGNSSWFNFS